MPPSVVVLLNQIDFYLNVKLSILLKHWYHICEEKKIVLSGVLSAHIVQAETLSKIRFRVSEEIHITNTLNAFNARKLLNERTQSQKHAHM